MIRQVRSFVDNVVLPYLEAPGADEHYPKSLIVEIAGLGLLGLNVPREFGGLEMPLEESLEITRELARGWLCLPSIVGSHSRIAPYLLKCGTAAQQAELLPATAFGHIVWAHAYNERGVHNPSAIKTRLENHEDQWVLNGRKDWVTNARDADQILVIARKGERLVGVTIAPGQAGVELQELERPGVLGVSLSRLTLRNCIVDPIRDVIGGLDAEVSSVLKGATRPKSLAFASRAVGAGEATIEETRRLLALREDLHPVANYRWGKALIDFFASRSVLAQALSGGDQEADIAKVFCTESLQRVLENSIRLLGGDGFANLPNPIARIYRDSLSLCQAGTSNDAITSRIGARRDSSC